MDEVGRGEIVEWLFLAPLSFLRGYKKGEWGRKRESRRVWKLDRLYLPQHSAQEPQGEDRRTSLPQVLPPGRISAPFTKNENMGYTGCFVPISHPSGTPGAQV